MTRRFKSILAGVLCLACLPAPLSASAQISSEEIVDKSTGAEESFEVTIVSDTFTYTVDYRHSPGYLPWCVSRLETSVTNANCFVSHIEYDPETNEPRSYRVNGIDGRITYMTRLVDPTHRLKVMELHVGDLLYIDVYDIQDSVPAGLVINPWRESDEGMYNLNSVLEYCGSGYDVFGDDFKKVMRYELYGTPWGGQISDYADLPVEKGDANGDDKVNLVDVVSVNKHLMVGHEIGFYGKLCADVDKNGEVDEVDSLNILKSVIGLVDLDELS